MSDALLHDALAGLTAIPKTLPGKYLWDETGSDLFDQICHSADYYPTAQETALLPRAAAEVARTVEPGVTVVEFGSGASRKIRTLLDALPEPAAYVAIDISGAYLEAAIRRLAPDYPGIAMVPVCADYSKPVALPVQAGPGGILGFYPGTSIGNFDPTEAGLFLERARATLGPSLFLVGADGTTDPERLHRAYGAADGLMAAFHRNILIRLNRECGADFDCDNFRHEIRLLSDPFRVEAHLVATQPGTYRLGGQTIEVAASESIRTDTSHKYTAEAFQALARAAGWQPRALWQAEGGSFNLHLLQAEA
ncbi:dimethylhistidine N-methyltransferase [Methylobacterium phyllostachyos]|uniref:Dimethylhistidine N-methyltransferase n=1 Tax=Methylobacterium phyllostachyos TaxID=582672 RepID=A0A1H0CAR5_9HYPH|nr:L-histidine N(alpha)-methyltransferase [Methylobacterium phyllostachyos]SDN54980.1 dimethylhistidine N-methyltransferase [Methylobacterium phyllostachyos]